MMQRTLILAIIFRMKPRKISGPGLQEIFARNFLVYASRRSTVSRAVDWCNRKMISDLLHAILLANSKISLSTYRWEFSMETARGKNVNVA